MINLAEDANGRVRSAAAKQQASDQDSHENTKVALVEETGNLKKKLQESEASHREKEQEARKVRGARNKELGTLPSHGCISIDKRTFHSSISVLSNGRQKWRTGYRSMTMKWASYRYTRHKHFTIVTDVLYVFRMNLRPWR